MRFCLRLASSFVRFHNEASWPNALRQSVVESAWVKPDFVTEEEESRLLREVEPHMKRLRYESSHWDDAIHLYREREQRRWTTENEAVFQRIRDASFAKEAQHLTYVHILDLHKDGVIKPHIDSVRYCGDVITGVSLLSSCVMRLRHKDNKDQWIVDLHLPRRSLYRLGFTARYDFLHEVLCAAESKFDGQVVPRERRISIICRDLPKKENAMQVDEVKMQPLASVE